MEIIVNGVSHDIETEETMPLLWILRDELGLKGTKYGCGVAQCGACTVHMDGQPVRSCQIQARDITGEITTIEGIGSPDLLHVVQQAWIENQVPQCGYCQSGQIMSAVGLLEENPNPTDEDIDDYMSGNLCRCGTYSRIRAAIKQAAGRMGG